MNEERGGFPWIWLIGLTSILLVGAFFVFPVLRIFPGIYFSVQRVKGHIAKMQKAEVYDEVGHSLAVYCQTGPSIFPTGHVGNAWLPKAVRDLNPSSSSLSETNAHIMMGGGFEHYGYFLERQPGPSQVSNLWTLKFY